MNELTRFVLRQGKHVEERWLREHQPDTLKQKCTSCQTHCADGRCAFNRAATEARNLRTKGTR